MSTIVLAMNIFILSVADYIFSTQRIYKEAKRRGHTVQIINHLKCSHYIFSHKSNYTVRT